MWPANDGRRLIVSMAADHRAYRVSPTDFEDQNRDLVKSLIDGHDLKDYLITTVGVYGIFDSVKSYFVQFNNRTNNGDTRCLYVQPFLRDELGNIYKAVYDIGSFVVNKVSIGAKDNYIEVMGKSGAITFTFASKDQKSRNFDMFQFLNAIMLTKQDYPRYVSSEHSHGFAKDFTVDIDNLFEKEDAQMKKLQEEIDAKQASLNRIRRSRNIGVIAETPRCADSEAIHGKSQWASRGAGSC
jgi:hypothetical protein